MPNKLKQELWILCQGLKQNCLIWNIRECDFVCHACPLQNTASGVLDTETASPIYTYCEYVWLWGYGDNGLWVLKTSMNVTAFLFRKTEYLPFESNLDYNSPNALKCVGCSIYLETNRYIMEDGWEENSSLIEGFCTILNQNHW